MKRMKHWSCQLVIVLAWVGVAQAEPAPMRFSEEFATALSEFDQAHSLPPAKSAKARILYRSAAQRLNSIVASGVNNGYLEYNIGNCYLQAGKIGKAILHYRRAQRLIPGDPYLSDNLREAKSRCLAKIESTRQQSVLRSLFFWHYGTSLTARTIAAICLAALFWTLVALHCRWPRRGLTLATIAMGLLAASIAGSIGTTFWTERNAPAGVVTSLDVIAYKGPGTQYTRQFAQPLQAGVEFTLIEARAHGWWQISLPDSKTGWIEAAQAELVTPPPTSES